MPSFRSTFFKKIAFIVYLLLLCSFLAVSQDTSNWIYPISGLDFSKGKITLVYHHSNYGSRKFSEWYYIITDQETLIKYKDLFRVSDRMEDGGHVFLLFQNDSLIGHFVYDSPQSFHLGKLARHLKATKENEIEVSPSRLSIVHDSLIMDGNFVVFSNRSDYKYKITIVFDFDKIYFSDDTFRNVDESFRRPFPEYKDEKQYQAGQLRIILTDNDLLSEEEITGKLKNDNCLRYFTSVSIIEKKYRIFYLSPDSGTKRNKTGNN